MAHIRCDFRSEVLDMGLSMVVFLPENISVRTAKTVYLLHGLADNATGWSRYTSVERYARLHNVAVVIPEVQRSFYTDMAFGLKYYSFVSEELPAICRNLFSLSAKRENCYIMGLSMGGYGALKIALRNPIAYAGCAAFSAVTDLRGELHTVSDDRQNEFRAIFGPQLTLGKKDDLSYLLQSSRSTRLPSFYLACGDDDGFLAQDSAFAKALVEKGATVRFDHWPGGHEWKFWDKAVETSFDYFFNGIR